MRDDGQERAADDEQGVEREPETEVHDELLLDAAAAAPADPTAGRFALR